MKTTARFVLVVLALVVAACVPAPAPPPPPIITGTAQVGAELTATAGNWSGAPTSYGYVWQSCTGPDALSCATVGTNASIYAIQASDLGRYLRARVTASNNFGTGGPAYSDWVGPVSAALVGATQVTTGNNQTCGLLANGRVKCWGNSIDGGLGNGTDIGFSATPVDVIGISDAIQITAGGNSNNCALLTEGTVKCWGRNNYGQLGNGTTTNSSVPVDVQNLSGVTEVRSGATHSCALVAGGGVKCWGHNDRGQLGNGTTTNSSTPVDVTGITGATSIVSLNYHSCALVAGGAVKCWGRNNYGQLGNGTTTDSSTPVDVVGITGATDLGGGSHTCALVAGGAAKCWGYNAYGALGNGTHVNSSTPVDVAGVTGATALSQLSSLSQCALVAGGAMKCWGSNPTGGLGDGTTTDSSTPVDVVGITGAIQADSSGWRSCALFAGGTVKCWGHNGAGALGNGTTTDSLTPVDVVGL